MVDLFDFIYMAFLFIYSQNDWISSNSHQLVNKVGEYLRLRCWIRSQVSSASLKLSERLRQGWDRAVAEILFLWESLGELHLMVVHEIIIDDDEKRFASLEDLYTGAGPGMGDDHVSSRDILDTS